MILFQTRKIAFPCTIWTPGLAELSCQFQPREKKTYSISALESFLNVTGTSELSKFRNEAAFVSKQVDLLPREYNGDCVFELPPITTGGLCGAGLSGMDQENDCYSWTRLVTTS